MKLAKAQAQQDCLNSFDIVTSLRTIPYHFLQVSSCLFHLNPIRPCFPKDASSLLPSAQQAKLDLEKV